MINRITQLFGIEKPIIQGGMVWCSGWKLATAVSNSGGLGLIGAGSMHPDTFQEHIQKAKTACNKPFGVNVPLLYPEMDKIMDIIVKEGIKIVFTSAGSPKKWTPFLKKHGITVVHVVSSAFFAKKCEDAGVDAIVAEGFEAGGHNGREETTTLALIPNVRKATSLPLIAAGGIGCGKSILAALSLGADGVQIGTRFAASEESSSHINFKEAIVKLGEGGTKLALKKLAPTRLIKNNFFEQVNEAECRGASPEEMRELLGKGRSKIGMFEGDLEEGELEIGQVSALISKIQPVSEIFNEINTEYKEALTQLQSSKYQF
ncbi:nitronate monooxygenase [Labilibaculum sp. DW002]|uniref:Nitronate monooxygenase n=1 Tax=Paralabilibaculum antarcticum TaxID=2912572 RepID=A0ABT5VRL7_9BACT|nr:nitronate monooxygenase [Labilibaculum sp. DW002]MDE5417870.1 nitronate monooxygenase [Labilibaculum sp. DW002]